MTFYKPQCLWNIALFILSEEENLLDCVKRNPDRRFTPQSLIRTHYHQVTGYADPFLFVHKEWLYLFYEEERLKAKAPLCAKRTRDLKHWESLGVVLKEDHHLSYPNVFEHEGEIYMMPETRECDAVILYKSVNFLIIGRNTRYWWKATNMLIVVCYFMRGNGTFSLQLGMARKMAYVFSFQMRLLEIMLNIPCRL